MPRNVPKWGDSVLAYDSNGGLLYGQQIPWSTVDANRLVWGSLSTVTVEAADKTAIAWTPVY